MIDIICPNDSTVLGQADTQEHADNILAHTKCSICGWEGAQFSIVEISDVTPRQMRTALFNMGVLASVEGALASLPDPTKTTAQIEWEFSLAFQRNRPLVAAVGQMLGWPSDQLDSLWKYAGSL